MASPEAKFGEGCCACGGHLARWISVKSLQPSKDSGPGPATLKKPEFSAPERTRSDLQGIEGAALPGEGTWLWKGLETTRVERRTLCCSYLHHTCCGYLRKLLRKSLAVTLGSPNLSSTQTGQNRMLLFSFHCLPRSEIPAEVSLEPFLHLVPSLLRRQQEVVPPSLGSQQKPVGSGSCGVSAPLSPACPGGGGGQYPISPELFPNSGPRGGAEGASSPEPNLGKSDQWETLAPGTSQNVTGRHHYSSLSGKAQDGVRLLGGGGHKSRQARGWRRKGGSEHGALPPLSPPSLPPPVPTATRPSSARLGSARLGSGWAGPARPSPPLEPSAAPR